MNSQEILRSLLPANLSGQTIERNGASYVLLEPLAVAMGLDWGNQHRKLAADPEHWNIAVVVMNQRGDGRARPTACLPLRKLPAWLLTVDPALVRPEIEDWLLGFQAESLRALHAYWDKGVATKFRAATQPDGDVQVQQTMQAVIADHHRRMAILSEMEADLNARLAALALAEEISAGGKGIAN
ncbi:MAG: phage antirepressor N-terminal domain-containing protein [Bacilli bacterium]|jgi:hypothetical protein